MNNDVEIIFGGKELILMSCFREIMSEKLQTVAGPVFDRTCKYAYCV